jgi:DUF4097 and DUF4098 domain-containing protein YvlB
MRTVHSLSLQVTALSLVMLATPAALTAQNTTADFRWEKALAANSRVRIHNVSGDVTVTPSTSGKVEVVGTKRGSSRYFADITAEVKETSDGIVVCVVWKDADNWCDERGYHNEGDGEHWGRANIDLEVKLPANLQLTANSVSGNVSVVGAQGDVRANSVSGDVKMDRIRASSVSAHTVSGSVTVQVESLTGTGDLSFKSVSGDVTLELPSTLDADLSMRSVSGRIDSDFQMTLNGRMDRRRLEARIGKGGRDLDVTTVSGDLRLRMAK